MNKKNKKISSPYTNFVNDKNHKELQKMEEVIRVEAGQEPNDILNHKKSN